MSAVQEFNDLIAQISNIKNGGMLGVSPEKYKAMSSGVPKLSRSEPSRGPVLSKEQVREEFKKVEYYRCLNKICLLLESAKESGNTEIIEALKEQVLSNLEELKTLEMIITDNDRQHGHSAIKAICDAIGMEVPSVSTAPTTFSPSRQTLRAR